MENLNHFSMKVCIECNDVMLCHVEMSTAVQHDGFPHEHDRQKVWWVLH
jgi:hypothetical protein